MTLEASPRRTLAGHGLHIVSRVARVSVIIAARDAAEYLPHTLESVFAQEFDDWEIVLVDDGSTDATVEVARGFGDRVRVISHEVARGPSAARNAGVERATSELVAMLDSDDLWAPRYLARQVALYDRARDGGKRVGAVCCDARLLGPSGLIGETFADRTARPRAEAVSLDELLRVALVYTSVVSPRSVISELGGYSEDLRTSEDYDLWLRMMEGGWEILWNPEPLAIYRLRPNSLTASAEPTAASTAEVLSRALRRGRLHRRGRRIARRQRRLYRLLAHRARPGRGRRLAALPLTVLVALEHPERWARWIRRRGPRPLPGGGLR